MWTATISSARVVFAYWSACMVLRSRSSTSSTVIGRWRSPALKRWRSSARSRCSRSYERFILTRSRTITGTNNITAHAPYLNFVYAMMTVTIAVVSAPSPLISKPWVHPGSLSRMCRRAIPACDSVNEVNTPIA